MAQVAQSTTTKLVSPGMSLYRICCSRTVDFEEAHRLDGVSLPGLNSCSFTALTCLMSEASPSFAEQSNYHGSGSNSLPGPVLAKTLACSHRAFQSPLEAKEKQGDDQRAISTTLNLPSH